MNYFKLSADQGIALAQNNYGFFLAKGRSVSIDLQQAAHSYKLSADQGIAVARNNYLLG
jgi:TPR repeat protein